ncbi:MAG: hypothetical protein ABL973_11175 [Micropepsaceae bacterium]
MVKRDAPLSRKALYDAVWSVPVDKLAAQYGISGRGLGKLCERHGVPVPPRGYWAKKASGKRVVRPPLIEVERGPNPDPVIKIWGQRRESAKAENEGAVRNAYEELWRELLARTPSIKIPQRIPNPHPLMQALIERDRREIESYRWSPHYVRPQDPFEPMRRRILQGIFVGLEARGVRLESDLQRSTQFVALVGQERTTFRVEEWVKQVRRELTAEERAKRIFSNQRWTQIKTPSGKACLKIIAGMPSGVPDVWRDDGSKPLEEMVAEFVAAIVMHSELEKARRAQKAEEDRRHWQAMQERERQDRLCKDLQARKTKIGDDAKTWKEAAAIRSYVEAVQSAAASSQEGLNAEALDRWVRFALDYADELDPLRTTDWNSRILKL